MKIQFKRLIVCIAIPLATGGLSAYLTRNGMESFQAMKSPPLSPPAWLFPVVWTILYVLMGIASYLVSISEKEHTAALFTYAVSLVFNFFWSIWFFHFSLYLFAFIWLIALWLLILSTQKQFRRISAIAGYLLVPYLLWVTFAGYLNFAIYRIANSSL